MWQDLCQDLGQDLRIHIVIMMLVWVAEGSESLGNTEAPQADQKFAVCYSLCTLST